jgi:TatD DNase family protein
MIFFFKNKIFKDIKQKSYFRVKNIQMLIDSHTHLYLENFGSEKHDVIRRAIDAGVNLMILPAIKSSEIAHQQELATAFSEHILLSAGLHPSDVKADFEAELARVEAELMTGKYIAVGECGIDLYWDKTYFEEQKIAFERQISLAKRFDLPLIIHAREAFSEIFEILDKHIDDTLRGVFHSFTGGVSEVHKILEYKTFCFGINGIVTFKNSGLDKVVKEIPPEKILLETDAPFLAPVPQRGKRNESAYLVHIAQKVAEIYGTSYEEIAKITTSNTEKLFRLNS